jgi:hypothetical protein
METVALDDDALYNGIVHGKTIISVSSNAVQTVHELSGRCSVAAFSHSGFLATAAWDLSLTSHERRSPRGFACAIIEVPQVTSEALVLGRFLRMVAL